MRKPVKSLVLLTIISFLFLNSDAQLKLPMANGIAGDVKKVVEDYPNRFINLMGEVLNQHPQSTDYYCNFKVNGAEETFVTRYSAKKICFFSISNIWIYSILGEINCPGIVTVIGIIYRKIPFAMPFFAWFIFSFK